MSKANTPDTSSSKPALDRRTLLKRIAMLLGTPIAAPIASGFLGGCSFGPGAAGAQLPSKTSTAISGEGDDNRMEILSEMAERILPATDTPGAKEAKVVEFIGLVLDGWFSKSERSTFWNGFEEAMTLCNEKYKKNFLRCSAEEQNTLLLQLDSEFFRSSGNPSARANFFHLMKQFTLTGYYTSEIGATQELRLPVMGVYLGCESFSENDVAWAW